MTSQRTLRSRQHVTERTDPRNFDSKTRRTTTGFSSFTPLIALSALWLMCAPVKENIRPDPPRRATADKVGKKDTLPSPLTVFSGKKSGDTIEIGGVTIKLIEVARTVVNFTMSWDTGGSQSFIRDATLIGDAFCVHQRLFDGRLLHITFLPTGTEGTVDVHAYIVSVVK